MWFSTRGWRRTYALATTLESYGISNIVVGQVAKIESQLMRILIAGCGYVGQALGTHLVSQGHQVFGLRRRANLLPPKMIGISADLQDVSSLNTELAPHRDSIEYLVYCAAADERSDQSYAHTYVEGLSNILSVLRGRALRRVLFTSSTAVYHQDQGLWVDENSDTAPTTFTGKRLLQAEACLHAAPYETIAIRLAGIYGPTRTRLLRSLKEGRLIRDRWTNRIHRDDCAGLLAHLLALETPRSTYIGVDNAPVALSEVALFLAQKINHPAPTLEGPLAGKRCRNARMLEDGYCLRVPSFREGYPAIVREFLQRNQNRQRFSSF